MTCQRVLRYLMGTDGAELKLSLRVTGYLDAGRLVGHQANGADCGKGQEEEADQHEGAAPRNENSRSWPAAQAMIVAARGLHVVQRF